MYATRSVRRKKALKNAIKLSEAEFISHVVSNIKSYMDAPAMNDVLNIGNSLKDVEKFRNALVAAAIDHINNLQVRTWGGYGNEIPQVAKVLEKYLNQDQKDIIVDCLIKDADKFYPYSRKRVISVIADFIKPGDNRAFSALIAFLRVMENDALETILSKIENGKENPDVQKILAKSKVLSYTKYNESEVKNNIEVKRALIKDIANTSTIAKKIPFEVSVDVEDIKALPPATRFSFLQFAYGPETRYARMVAKSNYYYNEHQKDTTRLSKARDRAKLSKLKMPVIDKETLKEMLFSVSLQKNEEMSSWYNDYSNYLDLVKGKLKQPEPYKARYY